MSARDSKVREFFEHYQRANGNFDVEAMAGLYGQEFMFADPQGVRAVKKADFIKVLPKRKEFFKSMGLVSSSVASVEVSELDTKYLLVKVMWRFRFEREAREPIEIKNLASFLLSAVGDSFEIVFQLDHEDLVKKAQDLGLR